MDAKQFLLSKGIFDYQYIVDYDGESIELEKLLTDYAEALQLQQTYVSGCFSDDHIGVIARNIAKEYAFENEYIFNQFTEAITKGMKIGRKIIKQNNA
jgi:hypothetical protein